jgi:hypothetical protein
LCCTVSFSKAQYSPYIGTWNGYLITDTDNADNQNGLPVTLFFSDDNKLGELSGEMTIQYRYQTDVYRAKYSVTGTYSKSASRVFIEQKKIIFCDILPKGLQWCFGSGTFSLLRNPYKKKNYLDGIMSSNCGKEKMRMIIVKK